jgi:hypothetical protein
VTHSNAAGLKVELERNTDKLVVSEIVELDDSGNWDIDLTSSLQDKDVSGNWILTISDLNGNDGKLTLADWCISVTYMSSDTVEVKGKLVLNGSDVAEDLASVGIHRKHFSDAAERTHTGDAVLTDTATTFNVAHGENALLLGLRVSCEERNSSGVGGHSTSVGLKISGVALGTYSIGRVGFMEIMTDYGNSRAISNHYITNTNTSFGSHNSSSNQYQAKVVHIFASLLLPDADTDFTITIQASHAADTAYVRNVVIDAVYVSGYTED